MYRALTLKVLKENINVDDERSITNLLKETKIELKASQKGQYVLLDTNDVTKEIRNTEVSQYFSYIAQLAEVRKILVGRQQLLAENNTVVMDGRDIGTTVLPNAEVKLILLASVDERAQRRHDENLKNGFESNLDALKKEISERDYRRSEERRVGKEGSSRNELD